MKRQRRLKKAGNAKIRNGHLFVLIEQDEDDLLVASVPSIPGCHTQAKDMPTLMKRVKEAILLCMESRKEPIRPLKFVGIQEISL